MIPEKELKTAAAIIINNKKILLVKRVDNTALFPGLWAFPGGKAESGETPEQNVIREVKEETNLDFQPKKLFIINHFQNRKMYRFTGNWEGTIKLQEEELSDFGWFTFNEAVNLKFAFDYASVILELRKRQLL